jgi:outer membrane protein assembly factor BamA
MLGGLGVRQFKTRGSGIKTRASNIQLTATYTLNKQINIRLQHAVFTPKEEWILNGQANYSKFPKNFWGIGPNTAEEDKVNIEYQKFEMRQMALRKIFKNIYLGPQWHFIYRYDMKFDETVPSITGAEGNLSNALGATFFWDKRDNILTPTQNHYLELSALFYTPFLQSEFGYQSYKIDARKYFRLQQEGKRVLAVQLLGLFNSGEVPFEEMGMIGGEYIMRGYFEGRYRDNNALQAQIEYRSLLTGRLGFALFVAGGNVFPGLGSVYISNTKWAVGAGLRYNINKADPTYIRLDYGIGENTGGLYLSIGEAF